MAEYAISNQAHVIPTLRSTLTWTNKSLIL